MDNDNNIRNRDDDDNKKHLYALNELDDYEVDDDDPDVRGWDVLDENGKKMGKVEELIVDPQQMKVRYLVIDAESSSMGNKDMSSGSTMGSDSDLSYRDPDNLGSMGGDSGSIDYDRNRTDEGIFSQNRKTDDDVSFGNTDYDRAKDRSMETRSSSEINRNRDIDSNPTTGGAFSSDDHDRTGDLHKSGRSTGDATDYTTGGLGDADMDSDRNMETRTSAEFNRERDINSGNRLGSDDMNLDNDTQGAARASDLDSNFSNEREYTDDQTDRERNLADTSDRDVKMGTGYNAAGINDQDDDLSGEFNAEKGQAQGSRKRLLIPIGYAKIDEEGDKVLINKVDMENIQNSPEYLGGPISREYETKLRRYLDKDTSSDSSNQYAENEFYNHQHFDESMFKSVRNPRRGQKGTDDYLKLK